MRVWRQESLDQIVEARNKGETVLNLAMDHGCTPETMSKKLQELAAEGRVTHVRRGNGKKWPSDQVAKLKELHAKGLSCSQIGAHLGVTRNAVIGKLSRLGLSASQNAARADKAAGGRPPKKAAVSLSRLRKGSHGGTRETGLVVPMPKINVVDDPAPLQITAKPKAPAIKFDRVTSILDLRRGQCCWPTGHPGEPDFHFCGAKAKDGSSYCQEHHERAYRGTISDIKKRGERCSL